MEMFRFEKLDVWQRSLNYADRDYLVTRSFPDHERFGHSSQLRRAAVAISSNIAEGSGRGSDRDYRRFVEIGYGSLMETVSQSYVARRQSFLSDESFNSLYGEAEHLARMLSGLKSSLLKT